MATATTKKAACSSFFLLMSAATAAPAAAAAAAGFDRDSALDFERFCLDAYVAFGGKFTLHVEVPQDLALPPDQTLALLVSLSTVMPLVELKYSRLEDLHKWSEGGMHLFPKARRHHLTSLADSNPKFRLLLNTEVWLLTRDTAGELVPGGQDDDQEETLLRLDSSVYIYENPNGWGTAANASSHVDIHEIYGVKGKAKRNLNVGVWERGGDSDSSRDSNSSSSLSSSSLVLFHDGPESTRRDLGGVEIRATVMDYAPMCNVIVDPDNGSVVVGVSGALSDSFNALAAQLNFRPTFSFPPDMEWGTEVEGEEEDGRWSGMVGRLIDGEADVTAVVLSITEERSEVVSFSVPMYGDQLTLLQVRPHGVSIDFFAYLAVFSPESWAAVAAAAAAMTAALTAADTSTRGQRRKRKRRRLTRNVGECLLGWSDLWRSLAVVWLSMLQRDLPADTGDSGCRCTCKSCCGRSRRRRNLPLPSPPPSQSSSVSVRLSYISACLASFVLFAFYTGVLTSLMTVSTYTNPVKSFSDALELGYQVMVSQNTADEDRMRFAPRGTKLREIYDRTVRGNEFALYSTSEEGVDRARGSHKNLILGSRILYQAIEKTVIALDIEDPIVDDLAFTFPKDTEFRNIFNYYLNKLKESGSVSWSERRWIREDEESSPSAASASAIAFSLGYTNVLFPFLIFVCGLAAALLAALTERVSGPFGIAR